MTMPDERSRALLGANQFLQDLLDPKTTPGVPRVVRERARLVLRHYPTPFDLSRIATAQAAALAGALVGVLASERSHRSLPPALLDAEVFESEMKRQSERLRG